MDGKHSAEMLKHLQKQSEVLMEAYRQMSHELHRLQVEEEMLMRKFYEVMQAQGLVGKRKGEESTTSEVGNEQSGVLIPDPNSQS